MPEMYALKYVSMHNFTTKYWNYCLHLENLENVHQMFTSFCLFHADLKNRVSSCNSFKEKKSKMRRTWLKQSINVNFSLCSSIKFLALCFALNSKSRIHTPLELNINRRILKTELIICFCLFFVWKIRHVE